MAKGAVWVREKKGGLKRVRRAKRLLTIGSFVECYYDPDILAMSPPSPVCLEDHGRYSFWYKPPGILAQGTLFGDHASLLRLIEKTLTPEGRSAYLVHRLDREASGLMLFAHDVDAAGRLSALFRGHEIVKIYRVEVRGDAVKALGTTATLDQPLDRKTAVTHVEVLSHDKGRNVSLLRVKIDTGRRHQIRRHLAMSGLPVLGDPLYGSGNKNEAGLRLCAVYLAFSCPFRARSVVTDLPAPYIMF